MDQEFFKNADSQLAEIFKVADPELWEKITQATQNNEAILENQSLVNIMAFLMHLGLDNDNLTRELETSYNSLFSY